MIFTTSDAGGMPEWGATRQEREDAYFPSTTPDISNIDRRSARRSQPSGGWGTEPTGPTGYGSTGDVDSFQGGTSERSGGAAVAGTGRLVWPMPRGGVPGATPGAQPSRKKQS